MRFAVPFSVICLTLIIIATDSRGQTADLGPQNVSAIELTLQSALDTVIHNNESLQAKILDAEIARRQYKAEKGVFEPAVVGSYDRIDNHRENTLEQQAALGNLGIGRPEFSERNDLWKGGLETLSPIGSRFRVGYDLQRLRNTLNAGIGSEYVTTIGATVTQPLLKNFGTAANMARIRLAAINSDIAYQDYRRQLMLTLSRAESGYWDLYFAQEQAQITGDSVEIADAIYKDDKARFSVGKSAELEVLEAQAGVSLRKARRSEAGQKLAEAASQLNTLMSGDLSGTNITLHASETPQITPVSLDYYESCSAAYTNNPDYLTKKHQALAENIRLAYSKNQRLPQLDLKGSYGLNGLGKGVDDASNDINHALFPSWSVGLEFRIPITGGIRERNELKAARLSKQKALVNLKEIEVQVGNALSTGILKVRNLGDSANDQLAVISFHRQLLETQLTRLEAGVIDSRTVLDTEEKFFQARMAHLENLIAYKKALLELELVKGTTLIDRNVELTKAQLQGMTEKLLAQNRFSDRDIQTLQSEVERVYRTRMKDLDADEKPQTVFEKIFK
jgi:outer membrane protein TolC